MKSDEGKSRTVRVGRPKSEDEWNRCTYGSNSRAARGASTEVSKNFGKTGVGVKGKPPVQADEKSLVLRKKLWGGWGETEGLG